MILRTNCGTEFIVDDNISEEIKKSTFYYQKRTGYIRIRLNSKICVHLHRVISNAKEGDIVDHINRNKLDNRLVNLRNGTKSENNYNRDSRNKLGRGIYFDKYGERYRACISHNNKTLKLGSFKDINDAKIAYNKKAKEIYGELAYQHLLIGNHFQMN